MAIAQGSTTRLSYGVQADFGTTATTWKQIPYVSEGLELTKDYFEGASISYDRQVTTGRHGNKQVAGDVTTELSYGTFDDFIAGVLFSDWATDVLTVGVTPKYFSFEKYFSTVDIAHVYTGCVANSFSLEVNTDGIVQGTFNFIGKGHSSSATEVTATAFTEQSPFTGFEGTIKIADTGGTTAALGIVTSFSLSIENGVTANFAIGSDEANNMGYGRAAVTGSISLYFEDETVRDRFVQETDTALDLVLTDLDGNSYTIELPRVKFNSAPVSVGGEETLVVSVDFTALKDATTGETITITRAAA